MFGLRQSDSKQKGLQAPQSLVHEQSRPSGQRWHRRTALSRGGLGGWNAVTLSAQGRSGFSKHPNEGHGGHPPTPGFSEG